MTTAQADWDDQHRKGAREAWTPGEWIRDGQSVYALYHNGHYGKDGPVMCNRFSLRVENHQGGDARTGERYGCTEAEAAANARLIAAAPDLYAAGKHVSELAEQIWVKLSDEEAALLKDAYAALDAALRKARGESQ